MPCTLITLILTGNATPLAFVSSIRTRALYCDKNSQTSKKVKVLSYYDPANEINEDKMDYSEQERENTVQNLSNNPQCSNLERLPNRPV